VILFAGIMGCDKEQSHTTPAIVKVGALFPFSGDLDSDVREFRREDEVGILSRAFKKMEGEVPTLNTEH